MSMSDPIADMLSRISNAHRVLKKNVEMPFSKIKGEIAKILKQEGYIKNFEVEANDNNIKTLSIEFKYFNNKPVIEFVKRISKPGIRIYIKHGDIPKVIGGLGIVILSTSKGIMTGQRAQEKEIGGELICSIY